MLATKFFAPMGADPNMAGGSRRWIMRECEDSLRRLDTDYIDLYQMHRPDPDVDIDETLGALSDLVHQGKVRYLGSSTFPASAIVEAQWVAERRDRERFVCEQPPYSILVRGIEADVLPTCERYGMAVIPWSPLAGGWLSGKWRKGGDDLHQPPGRAASRRATTSTMPGNQHKLEAADALGSSPTTPGIPLVHLAVAWVISNPAVTSAIIGPRTMEQLTTQLGATDVDARRRRARPHRRDRAARHQLHAGPTPATRRRWSRVAGRAAGAADEPRRRRVVGLDERGFFGNEVGCTSAFMQQVCTEGGDLR